MNTELNIKGLTTRPTKLDHAELRDTVQKKQLKSKEYTDKRRSAQIPTFQVGGFVRIKKPVMVKKGAHKFTKPLQIVDQRGPATFLFSDGPSNPIVRLVDGADQCSGRVELRYENSYRTVCDADFDLLRAKLACMELDCGAPEKWGAALFGQGEGQIFPSRHLSCSHKNDVGLVCSAPTIEKVRLLDGADRCSGRVEVRNGSLWGTVCDADFDQLDAEVVCRELGCGVPKEWGAAVFGQGEGQMWTEEIQCRGNESQIYSCPKAPSQNQSCSHRNDVGLKCSAHRSVRLVDGADLCAGRVEVDHGNLMGTVCDADFDQQDAEVMCRELKCGVPKEWGAALFGQGDDQMWTEEIQCRGN
ncbi:hypothetical protein GJAV_G00146290 [Gymnothorax javanicus]|nr:hypothetical protein GJAV_G00146290 [Gymnothorax javanicus]